jgi:Ca2+-binding RTX toxin-like protein
VGGTGVLLILAAIAGALGLGAAKPATAAAQPICLGKEATVVARGVVRGTAKADVIVTGPGRDQIQGRGGNDRICSGSGDDSLEGGVGSDRIASGAGNDSVVGDKGSDLVLGGKGTDSLVGKRGNDRLYGGAGERDFVDGGLGDDLVAGGAGSFDQVIGGVGNERLFGGAGDGDLLRPGRGGDTADGGPGSHDVASFALAGEGGQLLGGKGVSVDLSTGQAEGDGRDRLRGLEDVIGTPFADVLRGDGNPNTLFGAGGVDDILGFGGGDAGLGGAGLDRCRDLEVRESCELPGTTNGPAPAEAYFPPNQPKGPTLEVDLAGGGVASSLTAVVDFPGFLRQKPGIAVSISFAEGAWLVSASGISIAPGDACAAFSPEQVRCPISGTPEGVLVAGSSGSDRIEIGPTVPGSAGALVEGDLGADFIVGGGGDDSLDGGASEGSLPLDVLRGGAGDDALASAAGLEGGTGSDLLIAAPCAGQTVDGGAGADSVSFARVDANVEAEIGGIAGFAPVLHGPPSFARGCPDTEGFALTRIKTSVESIEGSPNDDVLRGDGSRNTILGRGGDDRVHGAGGDDFLVGGTGRDAMFGQTGADRLYARDGSRDGELNCGLGGRGDVAKVDRADPWPGFCLVLDPK